MFRSICLKLNNDLEDPNASKVLVEYAIGSECALPPSQPFLEKFEEDYRSLSRNIYNKELTDSLNAKQFKKALNLISKLLPLAEADDDRTALVNLRIKIESERTSRHVRLGLLVFVVIGFFAALSQNEQQNTTSRNAASKNQPSSWNSQHSYDNGSVSTSFGSTNSAGQPPSRDSLPQNDTGSLSTTPGDYGSGIQTPYWGSQYQYGTGSLSTAAAEQDELEETKPSFGQVEFTRANIRYCLFQNERLEAIRGYWKVQAAISEFNTAVND